MVVVVGKVESPPDKDQDQGENGVGGEVEAGEVEDAIFGWIPGPVKHKEFTSHFQLSVSGCPYLHQSIAGVELYFAGVENFLFSIQVFAKVGTVLHNRPGAPFPEGKQSPVPAQGKQHDEEQDHAKYRFAYAVQFQGEVVKILILYL